MFYKCPNCGLHGDGVPKIYCLNCSHPLLIKIRRTSSLEEGDFMPVSFLIVHVVHLMDYTDKRMIVEVSPAVEKILKRTGYEEDRYTVNPRLKDFQMLFK